MRADGRLLAGVFCVCFANLLLEVVITRLFSATMFYHFTFLAIALALFGVAASGVYVFIAGERLASDVRGHMARASRRFAIFALIALAYAMANPMDIIIVTGSNAVPEFTSRQMWQLMFLVGITAIPFFYSGMVVSLALAYFRRDTGRVYAWDLGGAAAAALTTGLVLGLFGGPTAVLVAMVVALVGAALFDAGGRSRWVYVALGALFVAFNLGSPVIRVPTAKGVKVETLRFEAWNSFSRVTVDDTNTIKIDASAATHIENLHNLRPGLQATEMSALAHAMLSPPADKALVIGPGGGRDVLHALAAGARSVTGVEVNGLIAETIMKGTYRDASGGLYADPRVRIVVDDGRSFVRRSDERFDIIQASLVDTWAATAAGAFALTENALYTRDAFEDYLSHLTDRGALTITRWHTGAHGETARLLLLAAAALQERGVPVAEVRRHMFYAHSRQSGVGTMVVKRTVITPEELARLQAACTTAGFIVDVSPAGGADATLTKYLDAGPYSDLVAAAPEELSPPTDDQPFFFYFKKARSLLHPTMLMNDPGLWILISIGSVLALAFAFILAPLVVHWRRNAPVAVERQGRILTYFGLVGFAFMVVEIALLQRFSLFLGHPSYSLLVILFSLLLTTAAGAAISERFPVDRLNRVMLATGVGLALLACVGGFVYPHVLAALIGLALPVRIVITVLLVAPSGVLMGAMIPSAIRSLSESNGELVPWGWGINGATSVVGTVLATVIAIYWGFTATFLVGAASYLGAGILGQAITVKRPAG
jgi:spermidine synthase